MHKHRLRPVKTRITAHFSLQLVAITVQQTTYFVAFLHALVPWSAFHMVFVLYLEISSAVHRTDHLQALVTQVLTASPELTRTPSSTAAVVQWPRRAMMKQINHALVASVGRLCREQSILASQASSLATGTSANCFRQATAVTNPFKCQITGLSNENPRIRMLLLPFGNVGNFVTQSCSSSFVCANEYLVIDSRRYICTICIAQ